MNASGMTLTSVLVALALTSITAVFGTRLVLDQLSLANTAIIMSKGESIFRFYSALILDSDVWRATLNGDNALSNYVKGHVIASSTTMNDVALRDIGGNIVIPSGGMKIKDKIVAGSSAESGGWWEIKLSWIKMGRGSVDLKLEFCLNKTAFRNAPENIGRTNIANAFRYLCSKNKRTTRIRYSENSVQTSPNCAAQGKAIKYISLHSGAPSRIITCSTPKLVNTNLGTCPNRSHVFAIKGGTRSCTSGSTIRTGVHAESCSGGKHIQVTSSGVTCSSNSFLVNINVTKCGIGKVVCGFNSDMTVQCCSAKGPDGVQGKRGKEGQEGPTGHIGPLVKGPVGVIEGDPGPRGRQLNGPTGRNATCG